MSKKKSFKNAFNVADNYETPSILIEPLIEELKMWCDNFEQGENRKPIVWCPFDKDNSNYVRILNENGFNVVNSHISHGEDFFNTHIDYDIAVSNPPFSLKKAIFERLYKDDKPFVMLMNIMALNYQEIGNLFYKMGGDVQFFIPDKKVSFNGKTSSFCSGYVCYKFIEKTRFFHLPHNNTGDNFKM